LTAAQRQEQQRQEQQQTQQKEKTKHKQQKQQQLHGKYRPFRVSGFSSGYYLIHDLISATLAKRQFKYLSSLTGKVKSITALEIKR
jgi:F0F1-type ATP synthase assembly protein I